MSASREKKNRQDVSAQGPTVREQKRQQEAAEARRSKLLYTVVGLICVVLFVFLIIWNTGTIQRNATAATINGVKYTTADVEYYFNTAKQSVLSSYYQYLGTAPFDYNSSTKGQVYNSTTGETWYDYLLEQALDSMVTCTAFADAAAAQGYTMSDEMQEYLTTSLEELDDAWAAAGYTSADAYIRANFGSYLTYDRFVELYTNTLLAEDYANTINSGFSYSDADYEAYYQENADTMDTFTVTQFVFQARVETTDDEGNTIEMTDEEQAAALEEAKAAAKAKAEELKARLEAGEDAAALAEEYSDDLYSYEVSAAHLGSTVNIYSYSDWVFDSARQVGDITLAEYDSTSAYNYYVARFEGRVLDTEALTANVRHILIAPETDEDADEPTEEQIEAAKVQAEELLAQWKAGEATEDSFAALAVENSADTGSASNGGLISGITFSSGYVENFQNWALDSARKAGDTGIVQSDYGWHIMYYVSGTPTWSLTADNALRSADYSAWQESVCDGYSASTGIGVKFIQS